MPQESTPITPVTPAEFTLLKSFRILFPEFSQYEDERCSVQLAIAALHVSREAFGEMFPYAVGLLAAHFLVSAGTVSSTGTVSSNSDAIVSSKSVGGVSVSYSIPTVTGTYDKSGALSSTTYGRRYLDLVEIYGAGCYQL